MHRLDVNVGSVITALTLVKLYTSEPLCMCISPTPYLLVESLRTI